MVTALKKQGLLGASLKSSLAKVQAEAGLATTGKLDGPTIRFLESKGWAPKIDGGGAGKRGNNAVVRKDGSVDQLRGNDETEMSPGDVFVIETPGGGAFGAK